MTTQNRMDDDLLALTVDIVASHVSNNVLAVDDLPLLIEKVHGTLRGLATGAQEVEEDLTPAVSIKKSVKPDFIVCLEDGKKLKMLKRHLKTRYNLTPEEYRAKWNLPADYPMVAPNYAEQRRELAKQIGLGRARKAK